MLSSSARATARAMAQATVASWRQRASAAMGRALPRLGNRRGAHRLDRRRPAERLQDRAVALGPGHQGVELLLARAGRVDVEAQPDRGEARRHVAVDPERAAQVEVALDDDLDAVRLE